MMIAKTIAKLARWLRGDEYPPGWRDGEPQECLHPIHADEATFTRWLYPDGPPQ